MSATLEFIVCLFLYYYLRSQSCGCMLCVPYGFSRSQMNIVPSLKFFWNSWRKTRVQPSADASLITLRPLTNHYQVCSDQCATIQRREWYLSFFLKWPGCDYEKFGMNLFPASLSGLCVVWFLFFIANFVVAVIQRTRDIKEQIRRDAFFWLTNKCEIGKLSSDRRIHVSPPLGCRLDTCITVAAVFSSIRIVWVLVMCSSFTPLHAQ